jgi:hypothetical protein
MESAAKSRFEPMLTDAAMRTNVCSREARKIPDTIKGGFAKGLWHIVYQ